MWMKVKVCTDNQYENLLLGAVYIPPENSKYVSNDVFEVLEEEYVRFSHDCKQKRSTEGCSKFKSPETRQVQERLVSTLEHMQVPKWDRTRCPEE